MKLNLPNLDQFEVVVFGRQIGECILIHSKSKWIIIDSALERLTKRPFPLAYFESIGASPSDIQLIIATHWHDDHIKGISDLLGNAENAQFLTTRCIFDKPFYRLALHAKKYSGPSGSGLDEFREVAKILEQRNQPFLQGAEGIVKRFPSLDLELTCLSPSNFACQRASAEIANLIPIEGCRFNRVKSVSPNDMSVATWISWNGRNICLGADLENISKAGEGWNAVCSFLKSQAPNEKAEILKVPHHGSITGWNDTFWKDHFSSDFAVVTAYTRQSEPLPKREDVERMASYSKRLIATTDPKPSKLRGFENSTLRQLKDITNWVHDLGQKEGLVRFRISSNETEWQVDKWQNCVEVSKDFGNIKDWY